jgi:hypothetical protein
VPSMQLSSTIALFNRVIRPEVRRRSTGLQYDSRGTNLDGKPTNRPTHLLRPTTFYLQGNDARLQLVPASTTAGVNGLDSKQNESGTADHRNENVSPPPWWVRLPETTGHQSNETRRSTMAMTSQLVELWHDGARCSGATKSMAERREPLELLECIDTTTAVWQEPLGPHDMNGGASL